MSKILILLAITAIVSANFLPKEDESMFKFMKFVRDHSKEYATYEEFEAAFTTFKINLEKVNAGSDSFSPFMDKTKEQLKHLLNLNSTVIPRMKATATKYVATTVLGDLPKSFDWRDQGAVNAIKDQGQCGSCWAFSAIANLEGQYFKKTGKLLAFSEQELVDCDDNGDQGCNGGFMDTAFEWLESNGLETEKDYPYKARGQACKKDEAKYVSDLKVTGFQDIDQNEDEIKRVLVENGPLSIAVDADDLLYYQGGIESTCTFHQLNHGIALVGYGEEAGKKFWIVRNSWGASWGEKGYARVIFGKGCMGMNTAVSTSVLA